MKFTAQHTFSGISLADYEQLYFDEAFNEALCAHVHLDRKRRRLDDVAGHIEREVWVSPDRQIPAPVAKLMGESRISYVETVNYTWGSYAGVWSTASCIMPDKIASAGTISFSGDNEHAVRTVRGDVTVKVFGLGGVIERFIVADIVRSYDEAAAFTQAYVQSKRG